jgi:hypothetical protein
LNSAQTLMASYRASSDQPVAFAASMSSWRISAASPLTFSMKVNSARSASETGAVRWSSRMASTFFSSPSSFAATAAWEFVQNKHWFLREVNAAISSRIPGARGEGPRITAWVNADSACVIAGLNAKRCQIWGKGIPAPLARWIIAAKWPVVP